MIKLNNGEMCECLVGIMAVQEEVKMGYGITNRFSIVSRSMAYKNASGRGIFGLSMKCHRFNNFNRGPLWAICFSVVEKVLPKHISNIKFTHCM